MIITTTMQYDLYEVVLGQRLRKGPGMFIGEITLREALI